MTSDVDLTGVVVEATKEFSPIEMAAVTFVKLIQANVEATADTIESFESNLFEDERLAWHDLTAAIAEWESASAK